GRGNGKGLESTSFTTTIESFASGESGRDNCRCSTFWSSHLLELSSALRNSNNLRSLCRYDWCPKLGRRGLCIVLIFPHDREFGPNSRARRQCRSAVVGVSFAR